MARRAALIEVLFLAGLMLAPALGQMTGLGATTVPENRRLAPPPQAPRSREELASFFPKLDAYLADHFGYRGVLIAALNDARFSLLRESTAPEVTRGEGGRLFLNAHGGAPADSLFESTCLQAGAAAKSAQIVQSVETIAAYYRAQGLATSFVVAPNAARIYADALPASMPGPLRARCASAAPDAYGLAADALSARGISFLYPLAALRAWRAEYPVYPRYFFHWTGETPWRVAGLLLQSLGIEAQDGLVHKMRTETSDLRVLLGFHLHDRTYGPDLKPYRLSVCNDGPCMPPALSALRARGFDVQRTQRPEGPKRRVVLYGDSFGGYFVPGLSRGYGDVIYVYPSHVTGSIAPVLRATLPQARPDRIVFLFHDAGAAIAFGAIAAALGEP